MEDVKDEKDEKQFQEYAVDDESPEAVEMRKREKRLIKKLDIYIAPVMMLLMLISYLDRGNIGFAATQGMIDDLDLKGSEYNIAVSLFYITYILAEFPTSLVVKRLQFKRVLPTIAFGWGVVCMCIGFVQGFASLVALRLLLGFFEGCLFPSMTLFLANWYKREELGLRISYLFIASALSGAFGGLIALGILFMNGTAGYAGWRWLYIIEGIITIIFSFAVYFLVPRNYSSAYFLNEEEKALMKHRAELMESYSGGSGDYTKKDVKLALTDIKTWAHGLIQIAVVTILYGFGTFLPIILKFSFHFSTLQSQYLVIPGEDCRSYCLNELTLSS
jgi:sugar phosphate permease